MSDVRLVTVAGDEAEMRLDRWFARHYPELGHGRLQKLLRTGQVRVDGGRVKAGLRLNSGQAVRVPPLGLSGTARPVGEPAPLGDEESTWIRGCVLYRDDDIIVINKPPGLAVQGGTGQRQHLDRLSEALRFGAPEPPRLVHRLDKDTSGVLVLARSATTARELSNAFRSGRIEKTYWAITVGVPDQEAGEIDLAIAKKSGRAGEKMVADSEDGKHARTRYRILDQAGDLAAWVALNPLTGRTHQLRVHCAALGTPIVGDGKYGGRAAFHSSVPGARTLHLHARSLRLPRAQGNPVHIEAPLPEHMRATFDLLGFKARPVQRRDT